MTTVGAEPERASCTAIPDAQRQDAEERPPTCITVTGSGRSGRLVMTRPTCKRYVIRAIAG
jgi:hypothetical protein